MDKSDIAIIGAGVFAMIGTAIGLSLGTDLKGGQIFGSLVAEATVTAAAFSLNAFRKCFNNHVIKEERNEEASRVEEVANYTIN